MACSGPGASPPIHVTTFSSPQKNWYMGNHAHHIRHLIDTSTLNREGTHDTPKSSLNHHHTASPASPYPLPELRKKCVAKSDTFSSKSLACQSFAPYRTSSQQFARPKKICREIGHIFLKIHRVLQPFSPP